jgi:hypothetical protein
VESEYYLTHDPDCYSQLLFSAGIGYSTVKHLARRGAKVYMAARNQTKAEEAISQLKAEGLGPGSGDIIWLELDLKDPRNAKKAAEEFMKQEKRLDVLSQYMFLFAHDLNMLMLNESQFIMLRCKLISLRGCD